MKAYKSVIRSAIASGYHVHIDDCEEVIRCGTSYHAAVEAIEAVEESWILVRRPMAYTPPGEFPVVASLYVIPFDGMDDAETVADWAVDKDDSVKNWADRWYACYDADNSFCGVIEA